MGEEVLIDNVIPEHLESLLAKLREMGVNIEAKEDQLLIKSGEKLTSANIKTLVYPGFPRSEEHTSELQSRGHIVCRLLLEKNKPSDPHHLRGRVQIGEMPGRQSGVHAEPPEHGSCTVGAGRHATPAEEVAAAVTGGGVALA